ncbi:MAG: ATP-binding protein [Myxococcota bacterium]
MASAIVTQVLRLGAHSAYVFLADEPHRELTLLAQQNLPEDAEARLQHVSFEAPLLAARAATTRALQTLEDVRNADASLSLTRELLERAAAGCEMSAPLIAHGRLVGVLSWSVQPGDRVGRVQLAALPGLTEVFAAALDGALVRQRERRLVEQLTAIRAATLDISTTRELPALLQVIVERARALTAADYAALGVIDELDPDGPFSPWVFSGVSNEDARTIGHTPRPRGLLGAVPREDRIIRLRDLNIDERFAGLPAGHPRMEAFLGVPLSYHGMGVGNLYLARKPGSSEFSEDDQNAVKRLAQHAAIAVEHVRAHEHLLREMAERKRVEIALRESEERFRRMAENAPDIIFRIRLHPVPAFDYVNSAVTTITGYEPNEFYSDTGLLQRILHPDDRAVMLAVLRVPDSFPGPLTLRCFRKDGTQTWLEPRLVPVHDEQGRVVALDAICRDITERVLGEHERERLVNQVAAERTWLRAVIETSPMGVLLVQPTGELEPNPRAQEILGQRVASTRDMATLLRRNDGTAIPHEQLPSMRALRGEPVGNEEFIIRRADDSVAPVRASAAPIRDSRGKVTGAVVVFEDITAMKNLERLREEWTSIVAHDLRQPVSVISNYAALLARQIEQTEVRSRIEQILVSVRHLNRMISDLMDISRLEAHQLSLKREAINLPRLVREVVERRANVLKGHALRLDLDESIAPALVDPQRVEQVLGNLLSNAVKYGAEGTPIEVRVAKRPGQAEISVVNQGHGIPPEELPHLFERFRRARDVPKGDGSVGLGLYICRGLVEAHGGHIWAESTPGQTTTFHFTLPVQHPGADRAGMASPN